MAHECHRHEFLYPMQAKIGLARNTAEGGCATRANVAQARAPVVQVY
jgi:hypothetical protein